VYLDAISTCSSLINTPWGWQFICLNISRGYKYILYVLIILCICWFWLKSSNCPFTRAPCYERVHRDPRTHNFDNRRRWIVRYTILTFCLCASVYQRHKQRYTINLNEAPRYHQEMKLVDSNCQYAYNGADETYTPTGNQIGAFQT
jgi:hypothetical protein